MSLTSKPTAMTAETSLIVGRVVQSCKNRWTSQIYGDSITSEQAHLYDFHSRLWSQLTYALSTGNEQNLTEFLHSVGKELARARVPLTQVVERSGICIQSLLEQALQECETSPEINSNPKALHLFLSRFNRLSSHLNVALVQGYNDLTENELYASVHNRAKSRAEQKAETLELFHQLSSVIGPGQFSVNRYRANTFLFNNAQAHRNCFYFIREGTVQLQEFLSDGRAVVLAILGRGDVFARNTQESAAGYFRDFQVMALRETEVVLLEEEALRQVMEKAPHIGVGIIKSFSSQLADIQQVIEGLLSRDITARLTHILLQLADEFGIDNDGQGTLINFSLTHQQLADMLGSNRVTITRRLGELQKQGLLEVNKHSIILYDRERLEAVAC